MTKLIQISFSKDANLETVREQIITKVLPIEDATFICAFPNRMQIEEKGFSMNIIDLLESTFGERLTWIADRFKTFDEYMLSLDEVRMEVAKVIDHIFVLDSSTALGVAKEIDLFSQGKVILM